MWERITMSDLWDFITPNPPKHVRKPKFPTRRWGDITTNASTSDRLSIIKALELYKEKGFTVRKCIDHFESDKFKTTLGGKKMYYIEIKK